MQTQDVAKTLELVKAALAGDINKTITTAQGLAAYDLQAPAKNLYPVYTPLRNRLPRVSGGRGLATNWKVISAINGSGYDNTPWVPEGQRTASMTYTTAPKAANYVTLGEEDNVTFEAVNAGRTFEDLRATMVTRLLQKTMLKEENAILGGNTSLALGTPAAAPTASSTGTGSTLPTATYSVIAVPLTQEGYYNSSLSGGVATTKALTGMDGQTYNLNGGSGMKSAAASQAVTLGAPLLASIAPIAGAVAWAWFVGAAGSEKLEQITTVNNLVVSTALTGGSRQAATAITADCSVNVGLAYDGLLTTAFTPANNAYVSTMATGNSGLTATGAGSIVEIDTMMKTMWDKYQLSPTVLYMNSQEIQNATKKVLATSGGGSLLHINRDVNQPQMIVAGGVITLYFNPFMPNGGKMVPVLIHPKVPPGTVLGWCEDLPMLYQNNEVSNVAEIKCRQDYYQIDWPIRTRRWESGVYAETVLAVYAPFAMGVITNIANA